MIRKKYKHTKQNAPVKKRMVCGFSSDLIKDVKTYIISHLDKSIISAWPQQLNKLWNFLISVLNVLCKKKKKPFVCNEVQRKKTHFTGLSQWKYLFLSLNEKYVENLAGRAGSRYLGEGASFCSFCTSCKQCVCVYCIFSLYLCLICNVK